MKRANHLFDRICERENLRLAVAKAMRDKRRKQEVQDFIESLESNLDRLRLELSNGTVGLGRFQHFTIYDPKERLISAPCFEERVIHHAIMNFCEPRLNRSLVDDTYACRTGKGREACLLRAKTFSARFPVFLKIDIRKYFDSVDHTILLKQLERKFKEAKLLKLLERVIACYHVHPGTGLPIGSLTSQHFANHYLSHLDRFIGESMGCSMVRYMDDIVVWGNSFQQLKDVLNRIQKFTDAELALELNSKMQLNRSNLGVTMLGCRVFPDRIELNRQSKRRFVEKLRAITEQHEDRMLTAMEFQARSESLVAFCRAAGVCSWLFRRDALQRISNHGLGVEPHDAWRQLEQQRPELPLVESE